MNTEARRGYKLEAKNQSFNLADFNVRQSCTSNKYTPRTTHTTNEGEIITIIGQSAKETINYNTAVSGERLPYTAYKHSIVQFAQGHYGEFKNGEIGHGEVKNVFHTSVFGVGYVGLGNYITKLNGKRVPEYELWRSILERCYASFAPIKYPSYQDVIVNPRWHNYQVFAEDIQTIKNYSLWKTLGGQHYHFDKDIKIKGNREYSREACMFVTVNENTKIVNLTGKTYIAERISDGYIEEFVGVSTFGKKYKLNHSVINRRIKGLDRVQAYKGWLFYEKGKKGSTSIVYNYKLKHRSTNLYYTKAPRTEEQRNWHTNLTSDGNVYTKRIPIVHRTLETVCVTEEQVKQFNLQSAQKENANQPNLVVVQESDWEIVKIQQ